MSLREFPVWSVLCKMKKDELKRKVNGGAGSSSKIPGGVPTSGRRSAARGPNRNDLEPRVVEAELVSEDSAPENAAIEDFASEYRPGSSAVLGEAIEILPLATVDSVDGELVEGDVGEGSPEGEVDAQEQESEHGPQSKSNKAGIRNITPKAEALSPAHFDPLTAYLREIRAYPPLSREEEHELGVRYLKTKDVEAAYRLVTSNLWLVVKIARDYERAARGLLDLVQEGNIGLMEAVKNFDPYRGVRFPSYAVWWIKAYMVRYLIANWRMVKIGTTQAQRKLFFNLKKEKDRLEREGFVPAPKLLAEKLDVKESEVIEMEQRLGSSDVSVDAPVQGGESDSTLLGVLPSPESSAEDLIDRGRSQKLIKQGLEEFAATLKDKERIIFLERMLGEEKATLQEISEKVGVSRERVRQIENRLRERLKIFFEERLGNAIEALDL